MYPKANLGTLRSRWPSSGEWQEFTGGDEPFFKIERSGCRRLFRTLEGLQQKAGVPAQHLRRLVLKEIADNALDAGSSIRFGMIDAQADRYFIEDNGPGLEGTPQDIASLFSISRPLRSSKLLRLPQRGQLGNGLRVVEGAVLASGGTLIVLTRNRRISLRPESDGTTRVIGVVGADQPIGTRVEIGSGAALPNDPYPFAWVGLAHAVAGFGRTYPGRSLPFRYDVAQFHELLLACGAQPVRNLIAQLDGCTGGKAGEIIASARLDRMRCAELSRDQARTLLFEARRASLHRRDTRQTAGRLGWAEEGRRYSSAQRVRSPALVEAPRMAASETTA